MTSRSDLKCHVCNSLFADEETMAMHQLCHLTVKLPFLQICPFCDKEIPNVEDCLNHLLEYFTKSKLEQARLLRCLYYFNHDLDTEVTASEGIQRSHTSETKVYELQDLKIYLPSLRSFKCSFCEKFYRPEKVREHVFSHHYNVSTSKIKHLLLWFFSFFKSDEGKVIKMKYDKYFTIDSSSTLLKELPENANTRCRYCEWEASGISELYEHYSEYHGQIQKNDFWYCTICNFKAKSKDNLLSHIHKRHIDRIPSKGGRYPYCKSETNKNCLENSTKLICPCCRDIKFTNVDDLNEHILNCLPWLKARK